jgi:hypothetical protein
LPRIEKKTLKKSTIEDLIHNLASSKKEKQIAGAAPCSANFIAHSTKLGKEFIQLLMGASFTFRQIGEGPTEFHSLAWPRGKRFFPSSSQKGRWGVDQEGIGRLGHPFGQDPVSLNLQPSLRIHLDGLGIDFVLLLQNPGVRVSAVSSS